MTRIDEADLQAQFDDILERCINGESFTITRDGKDICVLLPVAEYRRLQTQLSHA